MVILPFAVFQTMHVILGCDPGSACFNVINKCKYKHSAKIALTINYQKKNL